MNNDKPNPFAALLGSRKFLLTMLDVVLAIVGHFVGEYAAPAAKADIQFLTVTLQPVFVTLILSIAHEDASEQKATIEAKSAVEVATLQSAPVVAAAAASMANLAPAPSPFLAGGKIENRTNEPLPDRPIQPR